MTDLLDGLTADCSGCGRPAGPGDPVTWCAAWNTRLCSTCRWRRTEQELGRPRLLSNAELGLDGDAGP